MWVKSGQGWTEKIGQKMVLNKVNFSVFFCRLTIRNRLAKIHHPMKRNRARLTDFTHMLNICAFCHCYFFFLVMISFWSIVPFKKSKNTPLTKDQKWFNRELSSERVVIENVNARIKTFKIMSVKYRNRRKRPLLRMNLICGILNQELRW